MTAILNKVNLQKNYSHSVISRNGNEGDVLNF